MERFLSISVQDFGQMIGGNFVIVRCYFKLKEL